MEQGSQGLDYDRRRAAYGPGQFYLSSRDGGVGQRRDSAHGAANSSKADGDFLGNESACLARLFPNRELLFRADDSDLEASRDRLGRSRKQSSGAELSGYA